MGFAHGRNRHRLPRLRDSPERIREGRRPQVIAIGRPDENLPLPGAIRGHLPLRDWQDTVGSLIRGAHIVALAAGTGPGTVWEFTETVRTLDLRRLILLVYCDKETYNAFRTAAAAEYERRSRAATEQEPEPRDEAGVDADAHSGTEAEPWPIMPALPDYPPRSRQWRTLWAFLLRGGKNAAEWEPPLKGIVVFDEQRTPAFVRFDPTAARLTRPGSWSISRTVKREFNSALAPLTTLPRNQADGG